MNICGLDREDEMTKRVISLVLALCMMCLMVPSAFALDDEGRIVHIMANGSIGTTTYTSLKAACEAAAPGDVVNVVDYDSSLIEPVEVPEDVTLCIPSDRILRLREAGLLTIKGTLLVNGSLSVNGTGRVDGTNGTVIVNGNVQLMYKDNFRGIMTLRPDSHVFSNENLNGILENAVITGSDTSHVFESVTYANGWEYAVLPQLGGLSVSSGILSPGFRKAIQSYTLTVEYETESVWVLPSAESDVVIRVNGTVVTSGTKSSDIPLNVGANTIYVDAAAKDGSIVTRYEILATRKAYVAPEPEKYAIAIETVANGKITASHETAEEGTQVTLTAVPNSGYEVAGVAAVSGGKTVDVVSLGDNKFAFRMPDGDVSVSGTFTKKPLSFTDVRRGQWFYEAVMNAAELGWVSGVGNGMFKPNDNMRRGDFCIMMARIDGANLDSYHVSRFKDVPDGSYYMKAIAYCADKGYVSGVGHGNFAPDSTITREQMAKIIANAKKLVPVSAPLKLFNDDAKISTWAYDSIYACLNARILVGDNAGNVNPRQPARRAEAAAMLVRAFG